MINSFSYIQLHTKTDLLSYKNLKCSLLFFLHISMRMDVIQSAVLWCYFIYHKYWNYIYTYFVFMELFKHKKFIQHLSWCTFFIAFSFCLLLGPIKTNKLKTHDMGHDFLLFYIFLRFVSSTQKTCCFCLQGTIHKPLMYMSEAWGVS